MSSSDTYEAEREIITLRADMEALRAEEKLAQIRWTEKEHENSKLRARCDRLEKALEKIASFKQTSIDKIALLNYCDGYQQVAREVLKENE